MRGIAQGFLILSIFVLWGCKAEERTPSEKKVVDSFPKATLQKTGTNELFISRCASCHGNEGKGDGPASSGLSSRPADLTLSKTQKKNDAELEKIIAEGRAGTSMPPWRGNLTEKEISELVGYIRKLSAAK